ncbi:MAG: type II secretion system protein GspG, partial [Candidatus Omnitrophica bacterium]|nr:type II secretion system protein GspG [Candidatus Omnitrophota bacterium]
MMKKSFTLIELIVVIAIIAILAAIIAPNAFRAIEKAKIVKTASDLKTIKAAILIYRTDTGAWPCPGVPGDCSANYIEDSNHCLLTNPGIAGWDGPYLESIPTSSLAKAPAIPSCGKYGIYFSAWAKCCAT